MYNIVDHVLLGVLREGAIGETLYAQIARFFDTDAAVNGLSKKYWPPARSLRICVRRKTNSATEQNENSIAITSKDQIDTLEICNEVDEQLWSYPYCDRDEAPVESNWNPGLKRHQSKDESTDSKWHLYFSK